MLMVRAALREQAQHFRLSALFNTLDPSEKGAISLFLGQVQARCFAESLFEADVFTHVDPLMVAHGLPLIGSRPDFVALNGDEVTACVEVKGRSGRISQNDLTYAKQQAVALINIAPFDATYNYVHASYFDPAGNWSAFLRDPPAFEGATEVNPSLVRLAYYHPIMEVIRSFGESGKLSIESDYTSTSIPILDMTLGLPSEIYQLAQNDPQSLLATRMPVAFPSYRASQTPSESASGPSEYVGDDGVRIELGESWSTLQGELQP
jgi:hypothetical protein